MGYVYLLEELGSELRYKIGFTKNPPEKRLKNLKTGNSNSIRILKTFESKHYIKIEGILHRKYGISRHNLEWFTLTDEQVGDFIKECQIAHDIVDFLLKNNSFYK